MSTSFNDTFSNNFNPMMNDTLNKRHDPQNLTNNGMAVFQKPSLTIDYDNKSLQRDFDR